MSEHRVQFTFWGFCLSVVTFMAGSLFAASAPEFPNDPNVWINSRPLSLQQLRGKAVFLWFFEETCPRCRGMWPKLLKKAGEFKGQPIIFVAVNSGTQISTVRDYAKSVDCPWPILGDVDRSFERACKVDEISLNNITQAYVIKSDGTLHSGDWDDVDKTIREALKGAAWKLSPTGLPESLGEVWMAVELGNYKGTGTILRKSVSSAKKDVRESASKLQEIVKNTAIEEFKSAKKASQDGHHWRAYEICQLMTDRFDGPDLPRDFAEFKTGLLKKSEVISGSVSRKKLDAAMKMLNSGRPISKKSVAELDQIVTEFPKTDICREAQQVIRQANGSQ